MPEPKNSFQQEKRFLLTLAPSFPGVPSDPFSPMAPCTKKTSPLISCRSSQWWSAADSYELTIKESNSHGFIATLLEPFTEMITNLLCHLWDQEDQRCLSLLAFPEDQEDQHHPKHQWGQGYPVVKNNKLRTILGPVHLFFYTHRSCQCIYTFGPSGPGAPGIPLGPCRPVAPISPLSPGIPRSPFRIDLSRGQTVSLCTSDLLELVVYPVWSTYPWSNLTHRTKLSGNALNENKTRNIIYVGSKQYEREQYYI